ncbi:hypothetical protein M9H77_20871 [Catharanthus roseus]|uniref:Uncharacterized protein n=1 Tax=Catharanthus roseus TaxID=4058 RepID=A0ACC0ANM8_CATRO|nr:hypothetical protein M9H77_20871 [Catharanthus roseus]
MENFRHVKRIRKKSLEGGKWELSVILCLAGENDSELDRIPNEVIEVIQQYQLSTFVGKVCKYAASTKEEWEEQCKFWPTSFHPPTYNIAGITGFTEEDTLSVLRFMKYAVDLAASSTDVVVNAAVIVDPSTKEVISTACDQVLPCTIPKCNSSRQANCFKPPEPTKFGDLPCMKKHQKKISIHSTSDSTWLCDFVSCLHPWRWAEQRPDIGSGSWHPLQHAAMVAIQSSAARDRLLFPGDGHSGNEFIQEDHTLPHKTVSPSKRQKTHLSSVKDERENSSEMNCCHTDTVRPYLCTGYDIYLVWEPCTMCAMALVHQRVKRIFYALPNPNAGALGSVQRLQGEKSLNHHYAVFRVFLPRDILIRGDPSVADTSENQQTITSGI